MVSLRPQQDLQLKARADYWGGAPSLDGLKFVALAGEQPKIDSLRTDMFQPWSEWHGDVNGIVPDAAKAKELLDQAKARGFDGKITYVGVNDPDAQQLALAVQAQMNAVGFDVVLEYTSSVTDMVTRLFIDWNYDMTFGAYNIPEVAPEIRLCARGRPLEPALVVGNPSGVCLPISK